MVESVLKHIYKGQKEGNVGIIVRFVTSGTPRVTLDNRFRIFPRQLQIYVKFFVNSLVLIDISQVQYDMRIGSNDSH